MTETDQPNDRRAAKAAKSAAWKERRARAAQRRAEKAQERERKDANLAPYRAAALNRIAEAKSALAARHAEKPVDRYAARQARLTAARKRERERIDHLVLGLPRPTQTVTIGKRGGRNRPVKTTVPAPLSPDIERAVALRERWSHKANGTPETWEREGAHDDCLAQMHRNGALNREQLEWAAEIANVFRSIEADVGIKVASLEARVDNGSRAPGVGEKIERVRKHLAYRYWREKLPVPRQLVLDMIVGDAIGYTVAAKRYGIHHRKARRLLIEAIDRWPDCVALAKGIDEATVQRLNEALPPPGDAWWTDAEVSSAHPWWSTAEPVVMGVDLAAGDDITAISTPDGATSLRIDPAFLDDAGHLLPWAEIAEIIRTKSRSSSFCDDADD